MGLMKRDNIETLLDIHHCTGVDMQEMLDTTTRKAIQYANRAYKGNYSPSTADYDRATAVVKAYAIKHHNYTENWIE